MISITEKIELILTLDIRSGLSDLERSWISKCEKTCEGHDPLGILSDTAINKINELHFKFFVEGY